MKKIAPFALALAVSAPALAETGFATPCHEYDITLPVGLSYASTDACMENSGRIAVKNNKDKYGFINTKGELVIPTTFDRAWDFSEGVAIVKKGKQHGYIKPDGQFAIQPIYDDAWDFDGGLAVVQLGKKYGAIDPDGKTVIKADYDEFYPHFGANKNFAIVAKGDKWGLIDRSGKTLAPLKYDDLSGVDSGRIVARTTDKKGEERYGYLDYQGKVALPFTYEMAEAFQNGIARVLDQKGEPTFINKNGKKVSPKPQFEIGKTRSNALTIGF